jgi:transposase
MRKIKEVLRLRFGMNLGQDQIARSCSISQATVHRYLERAESAGLTWPLPEDHDDRRLNELLFPTRPDYPASVPRPGLDFTEVHRQMQANRFVTLQLLWEEYREKQSGGYGYSRFCELYQRWNRDRNVTLRQDHRAGEKLFVDWAGPTVPIHDSRTGETEPASLFVAVLGASTYTFAYAARGQHLANWIDCHVRAFEFIGGTTKLIVPDNPRTGVDRACRYEPDLNRTYSEMSEHYGTAIMPARPYKPRDKAKVENAVLLVERWILAALRHHRFVALGELNDAIAVLLKLNGSTIARSANVKARGLRCLQPLINLCSSHCRRSLTSPRTGRRFAPASIITLRSPSRLIHWAGTVGEATALVIATVLETKRHPEIGYRACLGIMRLGKTYSNGRLEAASKRALELNACSFQSLKSILKQSLDRQTALTPEPERSGPRHENIRGAQYFNPPTNLLQ